MKKSTNKHKRASVLVLVLAILFILSTLGISFVKITQIEMTAAATDVTKVKAKLVSKAGIQFALAKLRRDFQKNVRCNVDGFPEQAGEPEGERRWTYNALNDAIVQEDHMGAGVPIEDLQKMTVSTSGPSNQHLSPHPSYAALNQGTGLPEVVQGRVVTNVFNVSDSGNTSAYTLKILDVSSQLDLNSQTIPLGVAAADLPLATMLNNLSKMIASREPYASRFVGDTTGPLHNGSSFLGASVVQLRQTAFGGTFNSKFNLLELSGIDTEKMKYLWDYIAVREDEQRSIPSRACPAKLTEFAGKEPYRTDQRAPININTAAYPVLFCLFDGLSGTVTNADGSTTTVTLTGTDVTNLVDHICQVRADHEDPITFPFQTWEQFREEINQAAPSVFDAVGGTPEEKAALVYTMADPNVILKRFNPDRTARQFTTKLDITYYTSELCFYPQGNFEITSLGEIFSPDGEVLGTSKLQTIATIFGVSHLSTQRDFHDKQLVFAPASSTADSNAFSLINSFQRDFQKTETSVSFGYVSPIIYEQIYNQDDTTGLEGTNVTFRADYNHGMDADLGVIGDRAALTSGDFSDLGLGLSKKLILPPLDPVPPVNDTSITYDFGDLAADGVIFREGNLVAEPTVVAYHSKDHLPTPKIADNNPDGTLLLWFKLNDNDWTSSTDWRTIFFATNPIDDDVRANERGIQTEVQMNYDPATGHLKIQARRQYYDQAILDPIDGVTIFATDPVDDDGTDAILNNENTCPINVRYIRSSVLYNFRINTGGSPDPNTHHAIRPYEWYHLVVRWKDGTDLEFDDTATPTDSIILHGHFYDDVTTTDFNGTITDERSAQLKGESLSSEVDSFDLVGSSVSTLYNPDFDNLPGGENPNPIRADYVPIEANEIFNSSISADAIDNARMYIGAAPLAGAMESTAMTIDDVRIVKNSDGVNEVTNMFSRYTFHPVDDIETDEEPAGSGNFVDYAVLSEFVGEFSSLSDDNSVVLGIMDWTMRSPTGIDDSVSSEDPPVGGREIYDNVSLNVTSTISAKDPRPKRPMFIPTHGVEDSMWHDIVHLTIGENHGAAGYPDHLTKEEFRSRYGVQIRDAFNAKVAELNADGVGNDNIETLEEHGNSLGHSNEIGSGDLSDAETLALLTAIFVEYAKIVDDLQNNHPDEYDWLFNQMGDPEQKSAEGDFDDEVDDNILVQARINGFAAPIGDDEPTGGGGEVGEGPPPEDDTPPEPEPPLNLIGNPLGPVGGDSIFILPASTDYKFELKFRIQEEAGGGFATQFLAPTIDDLTITYQQELTLSSIIEVD